MAAENRATAAKAKSEPRALRRRRAKIRELQPRLVDALAVHPVLVSDLSAPTVVGLESRAFRAFVRSRGIPHVVEGRRLLVRATDLEAAVADRPLDLDVFEVDASESEPAEPSRAEILARLAGGRR